MEERLQKVEAGIHGAKEWQERCQHWMNKKEEQLRQLVEDQDEGVWRVWSRSHC